MSETLYQSLVLMVVGMAVVFAFMGLLIVLVNAFVALATRFFPDRADDVTADDAPSVAGSSKPDHGVVAAIAGAIRSKE